MVNMTSKGSCFANGISVSGWKKVGHGSSEIKQHSGGSNSSVIIQNNFFLPESYMKIESCWCFLSATLSFMQFFIFILCLLLSGKSSTEQREKALNLDPNLLETIDIPTYETRFGFCKLKTTKKKICLRVRFVFKERKEWESGPGVFH